MTPPPATTALKRGIRGVCPQCGIGALFEGWYELRPACEDCGLPLDKKSGDQFAVMYYTTAIFTVIGFVVVFLLHIPDTLFQRAALVLGMTAIMAVSLPWRKGLAVAMDYVLDGDRLD